MNKKPVYDLRDLQALQEELSKDSKYNSSDEEYIESV